MELHSNNAKASYDESKLNIPEKLPNEEDIKLLRKYCIQEINGLCNKYSAGSFTAANYRQLARLCLARGLTFDARRGGEISKSTLQHWAGVEDGQWKKSSEIENLTDPVEQVLAEHFVTMLRARKKLRKEWTGNYIVHGRAHFCNSHYGERRRPGRDK